MSHRIADFVQLGAGRLRAADAAQHPERLVVAAVRDQPAGTFGHEQQADEEQHAGHDHHAQHPPPVVHAADIDQQMVRNEGQRLPRKDGELVERHHASAQVRRGDLRDVERRKHRSRADRNAGDHAEDDERRVIDGERAAERRKQEDHGGHEQHLLAAVYLTGLAGASRAEHAADQNTPHGPALFERRQVENFGRLHEFDGPRNDGGVESEEQSAHRRDETDKKQIHFHNR